MRRSNIRASTGVDQRPSGRWRARITILGKEKQLGTFDTQQEAKDAYTYEYDLNLAKSLVDKYEIFEDYVRIKLSNDIYSIIDIEDINLAKTINWYSWYNKCTKSYYAMGNRINLQSLIMGISSSRKLMVDHINGDTLDNRKCNLRIVTSSQNQMNRKPQRTNTSGCKGVYFNNRAQKWAANIIADKNSINLGYYDMIFDAVCARKSAENKHHGEYAYNNLNNKGVTNERIN